MFQLLYDPRKDIFKVKVRTKHNSCIRNNVGLAKVNPRDIIKIGKEKYYKSMKLIAHQAAYEIARRGQGLEDKLEK